MALFNADKAEKEKIRKEHPKAAEKVISQYFDKYVLNLNEKERIKKAVIFVCAAHGLSLEELVEDDRFNRIDTVDMFDIHYGILAFLLRIGDLMDLEADRVNNFRMMMFCDEFGEYSQAHNKRHQQIEYYHHDYNNLDIKVNAQNETQYKIWLDWLNWLKCDIEKFNAVYAGIHLSFPVPKINIVKIGYDDHVPQNEHVEDEANNTHRTQKMESDENKEITDRQEMIYKETDYFIGRDDLVKNIVAKIMDSKTSVIVVHGVAGIGKTEICKAALCQIQKEKPDFYVPYIDLTGCEKISDVLGRIAASYGISISEMLPEKMFPYLCKRLSVHVGEEKKLAFLDNYEEVWYAMDERNRNSLSDQLLELANKGLRFLISSQHSINIPNQIHIRPLDYDTEFQNLSWDQFKQLNSSVLFCNILGREPRSAEKKAFRELITEINGHPLSLLLTAYSARNCASLNALHNKWHQIDAHIPGKKTSQDSLVKALTLTWNSLKDNRAAVLRWAIHSLSLSPLDNEILSELRAELPEAISEDEWFKEGQKLYQFGLVESNEESNEEEMLPAVKNALSSFESEAIEQALTTWVNWSRITMFNGDYGSDSDHIKLHTQAIKYIPEFLYLIDYCLDNKRYDKLPALLEYMVNYYASDSHRSVTLLRRILSETDSNMLNHCELSWVLADLLLTMGQTKQAETNCKKAEKMCTEKQDKQSMAYTQQTKGKILQHKGQIEEALDAFRQAEQLFKEIGDLGGQIDILYHISDLILRTGSLMKAAAVFRKIEKMYLENDDRLGRAYVLLSKGSILLFTCNTKQALIDYEEAKKLFQEEQEESGLANTFMHIGTMQYNMGHITKAMESYTEAENIFIREKKNYSLANILHDKGDIYRIRGQYEKSWNAYNEAEKYFKESQDNFSRAHVLFSKGEWLKDNGQYAKAKESFEQAGKIYQNEHDSIGQAIVLHNIGDLHTIKGRYDEAIEAYDKSEELCRNNHNIQGLANLKKSRGNLLLCRGDFDEAEKAYNEAEKQYRKGQFFADLAEIKLSMGKLQLKQSQYEKAVSFLEQALRLFQQTESVTEQCTSLFALKFCEKKLGKIRQASEYGRQATDLMSLLPKAVQRTIKQQFRKLTE